MSKRQVSHTEFIAHIFTGAWQKWMSVILKDQLRMKTLVLDIDGLAKRKHRDIQKEREREKRRGTSFLSTLQDLLVKSPFLENASWHQLFPVV